MYITIVVSRLFKKRSPVFVASLNSNVHVTCKVLAVVSEQWPAVLAVCLVTGEQRSHMDMGRNAYDARSTRQKTSAVSDQTDTLLLCTARDETNNLENCPCVPLLLDLQNEGKEVKVNSSRQILRKPNF